MWPQAISGVAICRIRCINLFYSYATYSTFPIWIMSCHARVFLILTIIMSFRFVTLALTLYLFRYA